jgi:hypothetical protein
MRQLDLGRDNGDDRRQNQDRNDGDHRYGHRSGNSPPTVLNAGYETPLGKRHLLSGKARTRNTVLARPM